MINEIEMKLALENIDVDYFINICLEKYPQLTIHETFRRDEYYDTKDMQIQENDFVIRIRKMNDIITFALKSKQIYLSDFIKKRIEIEFEIPDDFISGQLESQGLITTAIIEKKRISLKSNNFVIEVDKLPFIGSFVEIEASSAEIINDVCLDLHLDSYRKEKDNYGDLLDRKVVELGLFPRPNLIATFEKEKELFMKKFNHT